ncbi:MAG: carbon storage regulator CsrA [Phycisphaerales bacterium JB043]
MLVLSRHRDETIMIGDNVEITVVDIRGDKVRLGINAPTRIAVHRKEVYEAIRAENVRAAELDDDTLRRVGSGGAGPVTTTVVPSALLSASSNGHSRGGDTSEGRRRA